MSERDFYQLRSIMNSRAKNYYNIDSLQPICVVRNAHGGSWITALGAALNSDVFCSGGGDGAIRVWRPTDDKSRVEQFHNIQVVSAYVLRAHL